jgi:hypothetical protein
VPKGLLNYYSSPLVVLFFCKPSSPQLLHDLRKKLGSRGQVKKIVSFRMPLPVHIAQPCSQGGIGGGIAKISALIVEPLRKPVPGFGSVLVCGEKPGQLTLELLRRQLIMRQADQGKILGKQFGLHEVVKRRSKLAHGEVARGSKQHHHAWTSSLANFLKLVFLIRRYRRRHGPAPS